MFSCDVLEESICCLFGLNLVHYLQVAPQINPWKAGGRILLSIIHFQIFESRTQAELNKATEIESQFRQMRPGACSCAFRIRIWLILFQWSPRLNREEAVSGNYGRHTTGLWSGCWEPTGALLETPVRLSWARGMVLIEHQELFPADPLAWSRGE